MHHEEHEEHEEREERGSSKAYRRSDKNGAVRIIAMKRQDCIVPPALELDFSDGQNV